MRYICKQTQINVNICKQTQIKVNKTLALDVANYENFQNDWNFEHGILFRVTVF